MEGYSLGIDPQVMENLCSFQQGNTKVRFVFLGKGDLV